jgi:hypothetical protein
VYGLAATLYFALTGVAPFQGGNLTILDKKLKGNFRPPSQLVRPLPTCYDDAMARALDPSPSRRPRSCGELVAMLPTVPAAGPTEAGQVNAKTSARGSERRRAVRYPTRRPASCRPMQGGLRRLVVEVLDISRAGVQLRIDRYFESGTLLELAVPDEANGARSRFLVRVSWVREISRRDWALGCAFSRALDEIELAVFLGETSGTVVVSPSR